MTNCDTDQLKKNRLPLVFIIGTGRSGTTLLRYMLNAHPNIYIAEEVSFHAWMQLFRFNNAEKALKKFFLSFSFKWLRVDPAKIIKRLKQPITWDASASIYYKILETRAQEFGKKRFGEKNPLFAMYLKKLFYDFPDARIINVVRDPRASVYSHFLMPWSSPSMYLTSLLLKIGNHMIHKFNNRILTIRIEDLVNTPEPLLRQVLDFIGEKWDDRVLHHNDYIIPHDGIPFPWLGEASGKVKKKKHIWKDKLSSAWIRIIENHNNKFMRRYHYERLQIKTEPGMLNKLSVIFKDMLIMPGFLYRLCKSNCALFLTPFENSTRIQALMHNANPEAWQRHPEWDKDLPVPPDVEYKGDSMSADN